jgi:hypothetical protein
MCKAELQTSTQNCESSIRLSVSDAVTEGGLKSWVNPFSLFFENIARCGFFFFFFSSLGGFPGAGAGAAGAAAAGEQP